MAVLQSRFVLIDSSSLSKMADAFWSERAEERIEAVRVRDWLIEQGWVPVLTYNHLVELCAHGNKQKTERRLKFLRDFLLVGALNGMDKNAPPSTLMNVFGIEIMAMRQGAESLDDVIAFARTSLFRVARGREAIPSDEAYHTFMRDYADSHLFKTRAAASLIRGMENVDPDTKLRDLCEGKVRRGRELQSFLGTYVQKLATNMVKHGDKRLSGHKNVASGFVDELRGELLDLNGSAREVVDRLLLHLGFVPDEAIDWTVGEVSSFFAFRQLVGHVAPRLNCTQQEAMAFAKPALSPTWLIDEEFARIQNKAERVSGSDFSDRQLAGMGFYVDAVEVDKRTMEFDCQLRRTTPSLGKRLCPFFKCGNYSDLPIKLAEIP